MAWDERGRLWIAETKDYPNSPQPNGQGNDVIKILEDTNHDGRADKATIFADKLSIVSSLVFVNGGIIVSQAGELVALKDTNGDDKADVREPLITGWGMRDTHALASNLKYGLDNWIWGAVGYSGFNGVGRRQRRSRSIRRSIVSRETASRWSTWPTFTNNTWGLGFNETFDVFGSTANGEHSDYVAIPRPYYQGVTGLTGDGKKKLDGHYAMQANTPRIRQVDVQGGFTAAAGHNFYTARAFPQEYWNRVAFVNEPTGHVVHRAVIERQGSGFAEKDGWNVAASDDEWFAPVHAEVGPDGALWFLDFYDFIIQHNPRRSAGRRDIPERTRQRVRHAAARARARPDLPPRVEGRQAVHADIAQRQPAARTGAGAPPRQHVLADDGAAAARRARQYRCPAAAHRHRQRPHRRRDRTQLPRRPRAVDDARPGRARWQECDRDRRGDARAQPSGCRRAQGGAVGAAEDRAVGHGPAVRGRAHRQGFERRA